MAASGDDSRTLAMSLRVSDSTSREPPVPCKPGGRINVQAIGGNPTQPGGGAVVAAPDIGSDAIDAQRFGTRYTHTARPSGAAALANGVAIAAGTGNSRLTSQLPGAISAHAFCQARAMLSGRWNR